SALLCRTQLGGADALLIKPQLFMNRSGAALRPVLDFYRIGVEELLVVYDELDLDVGVLRLRRGGSSGGPRGIADLLTHLPSGDFFRLRLGIGHPRRRQADEPESHQDVVDYVLGVPRGEERTRLEETEARACDAAELLIRE